MSINLHLPDNVILKPSITVFGVGGAGCNAVNNMIAANLMVDSNTDGVRTGKFVVANTDAQCLEYSKADIKIQLGETTTRGLGAGAAPEVGRIAAEESLEQINEQLEGCNMVFITAGMGGGTGTGAAPVVAEAAKRKGILTVGVVTKPFHFEGVHRMKMAEQGVLELQKYVDTLIIIPNQNLFRIANERTTFADAFKLADNVLHAGVRGVTDLMTQPGLINLDFADIRAVMSEMGKAMMGTGEAEGENRAIVAAEAAISNPLLDHSSMKGAKGVLINITGGFDMTLFEVDEAANRIRDEVDPDANIIFGSAFNSNLDGKIRVSVVATGIQDEAYQKQIAAAKVEKSTLTTSQASTVTTVAEPAKKEVGYTVNPQDYKPDFAKKNIPSYGQLAKENAAPVKETMEEEPKLQKEDVFISAPAKDPDFEFQATKASNFRSERYSEPQPKQSFFERFVSSVGFTKNTPKVKPKVSYKEEMREEGDVITEDILDIPAFQRRKK